MAARLIKKRSDHTAAPLDGAMDCLPKDGI
jgi:hypothetical protein